jgi:hypothetical protein
MPNESDHKIPGPSKACERLHSPRTSLWLRAPSLALAVAALLLGSLQLVAAAQAEDLRPKEIPYDSPDSIPQLSPDYRQLGHKVVLITDDRISPRSVQLRKGQPVAWISYSQNAATIVFEREVARSMRCHSLVNFSIVEDELKSAPIHPGEFASFCELLPGRYSYIVTRPNQAMESRMQSQDRMRGEIIVNEEGEGKGEQKGEQKGGATGS